MAGFDPAKPAIARIYDYLLNGKDNFAADREVAARLMGFLLHFFEPDDARDLVARYAAALAPGSYVVLSVGRADGVAAKAGFSAYSSGATRVYNHSVPEFASFFGNLKLVPPGVVDAREWHPDLAEIMPVPPREGQAIVGVARVSLQSRAAGRN